MSKISRLKKVVKYNYVLYQKAMDNLDCGITLAEHISSTVSTAKRKCNEALDELAKLDPKAPKGRL